MGKRDFYFATKLWGQISCDHGRSRAKYDFLVGVTGERSSDYFQYFLDHIYSDMQATFGAARVIFYSLLCFYVYALALKKRFLLSIDSHFNFMALTLKGLRSTNIK